MQYQDVQLLKSGLSERYALRTVNLQLTALRGVFRACRELDKIDPDTHMRLQRIKPVRGYRKPKGRMLSLDEQAALFRVCAADPNVAGARDAAALALMLGAGLRRAETASLTCEAVNMDEGVLRIVGKGNKERIVPLPNYVVGAVKAWLEVRGCAPGPLLVRLKKMDWFVWKDRLVPLVPDGKALGNILVRRCRQAGIERCTPHDLRRTYISTLLDAGVDVVIAQRLAGHANVATTALYDRRPDHVLRAAVDRLPAPFGC